MKKINGKHYRRFKGWTGKTYWIEMSRAEVLQVIGYRATVLLTPAVFIIVMAWAAGLLN